MKTAVLLSGFVICTSLLVIGCGDGGLNQRTQFPINKKASGKDGALFKADQCLAQIKSGKKPLAVQNGSVTTCAYVEDLADAKLSEQAKKESLPYGAGYLAVPVDVSYRASTKNDKKVFLIPISLHLPTGVSVEAKKAIEDTITDVCLPKIDELWRKSNDKLDIGLSFDIVSTVVKGEPEAPKDDDFRSSVRRGKPVDLPIYDLPETKHKGSEFAIGYWPFHSTLILGPKGDSEPFCRSLAKLSAMWMGIQDPVAPKEEGANCPAPAKNEYPEKDSVLVGFTSADAATKDQEGYFWTRVKIKEERDLKNVLESQCPARQPVSRPKGSKRIDSPGAVPSASSESDATPSLPATDSSSNTSSGSDFSE